MIRKVAEYLSVVLLCVIVNAVCMGCNKGGGDDSSMQVDEPLLPPVTVGIWTTKEELATRPTGGPAWDALKAAADKPLEAPSLSTQDSVENSNTLARALVYARTGDQTYRAKVIQQVLGCMSTATGHTLALGRQLGAYVIAADLVGLEPDENRDFRIFLRAVQVKTMSDGESLISRTLGKANNWNVCGFSWACCARYLGDTEGLEENSRVLRGWLGDFAAYRYPADAWGELWWQADPQNPVGVNPPDTFIQGHPVYGVLPEELRRSGIGFYWPPERVNYAYTGLQSVVCWAEVLFRADYPAWEWGDKAFLRAFQWLHDPEVFNPPFTVADSGGDDIWMAWVINKRYGTSFPAPVETKPGRNVAHTSWTHE